MELISQQKIDHFLGCKTMAIVGASRKKKSFSREVARHLKTMGYNLWYVNPGFEPYEAENRRLQSVAMLPPEVNNLLVLTPKDQTETVVEQAVAKGIKNLWIQQHSETPEALKLAQQSNLNTVHHLCIFMFTQPEGVHKFHHSIKKIFGTLPK